MNKKIAIPILVIFCILFITAGFTGTQETAITISSDLMAEQPDLSTNDKIAGATKTKLGVDVKDKPGDVKLKLNLKYKENTKEDIQTVKGTGILLVNGDNYSFNIDESCSYLKTVVNKEGKKIFYGPLEGKIKNKQGKEETLSIGATFIPGENAVFSVFLGEIGNEAILFFGNQFIDEETYQLISQKGW